MAHLFPWSGDSPFRPQALKSGFPFCPGGAHSIHTLFLPQAALPLYCPGQVTLGSARACTLPAPLACAVHPTRGVGVATSAARQSAPALAVSLPGWGIFLHLARLPSEGCRCLASVRGKVRFGGQSVFLPSGSMVSVPWVMVSERCSILAVPCVTVEELSAITALPRVCVCGVASITATPWEMRPSEAGAAAPLSEPDGRTFQRSACNSSLDTFRKMPFLSWLPIREKGR